MQVPRNGKVLLGMSIGSDGTACREREGSRPGAGSTWRAKDPTKRPSCALVARFVLALLDAADAPLLATLVAVRCGIVMQERRAH